ncbi:CPSF A subunit region-domain-containing protein [Suillus americanus]|nr:CPSF A subunit region-domain-containing protein [Suillus americanus]KAG2029549.1 CPSF A subunit region-domain-containing protein [Suillus americanus]
MAIYESLPAPASAEQSDPPLPNPRTAFLKVEFHKVVSKTFEIQRAEEMEKTVLAEHKRISRTFVPFMTSPNMECTLTGAFFAGDRPCWIMATDKGGLRVVPSGHTVIKALTRSCTWGSALLEWTPEVQPDSFIPYRSVPRSRAYSNIIFEPSASLIVAASPLQARFTSYDEDGNVVWEPDDCSTLELISPEHWVTMDGYEFASDESVNSLTCVSLETTSTESGTKNFIAVGATINRGEFLAVKWYKLKLRVKDDAKGPVTAVCGINGYLASSMGQKADRLFFVCALDLDERLVGIAFLDVGVCITSLRSMKNLHLIRDAMKSVWLVAFQENPYKLVTLAKDVRRRNATTVNFFFAGGDLAVVSDDKEGVLRLFAYDPSKFHSHKECRSTIMIARRTKDSTTGVWIYGWIAITPVDEAVFKDQ